MATYRKRHGKWQTRIQTNSGPTQARTFFTMRDAKLWARKVERDINLGIHTIKPALITVGEAFKRYLTEVTPRKKSAAIEQYRIEQIGDEAFDVDDTHQTLSLREGRWFHSVSIQAYLVQLSL